MQYCRNCGTPLSDDACFCTSCGNRVVRQIIPMRAPSIYGKRELIHPDVPEGKPSSTEAVAFLALSALLAAAVFISAFFV